MTLGPQIFRLSKCLIDFCWLQNSSKHHMLFLNRPKNSNFLTDAPKVFNFNRFGMPFGAPFSINFRDLLNLLNCNKYNAITSITSQGTSFLHQFYIISSVFRHRSWSPLFNSLCWFYQKIVNLGTPSKSSGRQNGTTNRPRAAKLLKNVGGRTFCRRVKRLNIKNAK